MNLIIGGEDGIIRIFDLGKEKEFKNTQVWYIQCITKKVIFQLELFQGHLFYRNNFHELDRIHVGMELKTSMKKWPYFLKFEICYQEGHEVIW